MIILAEFEVVPTSLGDVSTHIGLVLGCIAFWYAIKQVKTLRTIAEISRDVAKETREDLMKHL